MEMNEKAFIIASIQLKIEAEKREKKKAEARTKSRSPANKCQ